MYTSRIASMSIFAYSMNLAQPSGSLRWVYRSTLPTFWGMQNRRTSMRPALSFDRSTGTFSTSHRAPRAPGRLWHSACTIVSCTRLIGMSILSAYFSTTVSNIPPLCQTVIT